MYARLAFGLLAALLASNGFAYNTTTATFTRTYHSSTTTFTRTELAIPTAIQTLDVEAEALIINFAPELTSVDPSVASKLAADVESFQSEYMVTHPPPPIITGIDYYFNSDVDSKSIPPDVWRSIIQLGEGNPFGGTVQQSELAALMSPYPILSSAVVAYQSAAKTYDPQLILAEASIVSEELSLTASPPGFLTLVSNYLPSATATTGTSSSGGDAASTSVSTAAAAPTTGSELIVNAVAAVAGVVGVALL